MISAIVSKLQQVVVSNYYLLSSGDAVSQYVNCRTRFYLFPTYTNNQHQGHYVNCGIIINESMYKGKKIIPLNLIIYSKN
jgi:hypothetical protein